MRRAPASVYRWPVQIPPPVAHTLRRWLPTLYALLADGDGRIGLVHRPVWTVEGVDGRRDPANRAGMSGSSNDRLCALQAAAVDR